MGMDTEVWHGGSGDSSFPTPNTPCPVQCLMRGPWGRVLGSGAVLAPERVTDWSHNTTVRRWKQGQAMKEKFVSVTSAYRHVFRKADNHLELMGAAGKVKRKMKSFSH